MRQFVAVIFTFLTLTVFGQDKHLKLTVVLFDNQNLGFKVTIDTLLKAKDLDIMDAPIDLFFASKYFHLPYYVPTKGIFKNDAKDKECDMNIYPENIKCYEYDKKNRVVKMSVNGSGTMNNFIYKYNDGNQVVEISDFVTKYILKYNTDATLSELIQSDGIFNKKLVFIYN